ncbi:MAG: ATP-binding cassette domain-containing protein [Myxococcota bacterium]|nr:ATP-binding cassette domain-containing protein [Myxococcota bacterium]
MNPVASYYVKALRRVLRPRARLLAFFAASAMHAVGHALVALVAGGVAAGLAQRCALDGEITHGSTGVRTAGRVLFVRGGAAILDEHSRLADKALFLSLLGLGVVFVKSVGGVYATYVQGRVAGEVGSALRLQLLDALLVGYGVRGSRHDDHGPTGSVSATARGVSALTERVQEVELGLKLGWLGGLRALAQLLPLAALLLFLSPTMAATAAFLLGAFSLLLGRLRGGYRRAAARGARERERLLEAADESVRYADLWVTYGAQGHARARVTALGQAMAAGAAWLDARAAALSGGNEVLGAAALVAATAASGAGLLGVSTPEGTLLAFAVAFFLAYRPIRELADARLAMARAASAYDELRLVIDAAAHTPHPPATCPLPPPPFCEPVWALGPLEVRGLRLAYGACGPVSLRVEAGSIVAIVGPTGVGKTTLVRTLLGLEPAAAGEVLFNGVPLGDAPAGPSFRPFAWVPQDAPLLAETLEANIALGAPGADARHFLDPLRAAHLDHALGSSRLGAGGRSVSGGERQWIALARAIATSQPVLLLDEPTSGLDHDAQRAVLEAIARLRGHRTVILVTHRSEPLAVADAVFRLDPDDPLRRAA